MKEDAVRVLIDGENLRHQIAHVLVAHRKISDKNAFFGFDFAGFCQGVLGSKALQIVYYTTKIRQPHQKIPAKLAKQIVKISEANRKWIAQLTNQNITVVKAGHLRVRETNACVHCGKKTLVLQEKGVDVRVATDLLLDAKKGSPTVLGSSDSDLVPALQTAKRAGANIVYLCYAGQRNRSIAAQAKKIITFDDAAVLRYFGQKP